MVSSDSLSYCRLWRGGCLETFRAYEILKLKFEVVLIITSRVRAAARLSNSSTSKDLFMETSKADLFFVYFGDFIKMLDALDALSSRLRRKNQIQRFFVDISAAMKIRILNHTNASQVSHAVILVRGCVENYSAEVWRKHSRWAKPWRPLDIRC